MKGSERNRCGAIFLYRTRGCRFGRKQTRGSSLSGVIAISAAAIGRRTSPQLTNLSRRRCRRPRSSRRRRQPRLTLPEIAHQSRSSGTATQRVSAPTSIPAALRCIFFKRARSLLCWLLVFFDGFLVIAFLLF